MNEEAVAQIDRACSPCCENLAPAAGFLEAVTGEFSQGCPLLPEARKHVRDILLRTGADAGRYVILSPRRRR